jgi:PII-like signaling protein
MEKNTPAGILRIYISSTDKFRQTPLYEFIALQAKKEGIAGATVLKGMMGYGASSVIHSYKFWEVSDKVPTVIELIDKEDKLLSFYERIRPQLETMSYGCLATFDKTTVLLYKSGEKKMFDV